MTSAIASAYTALIVNLVLTVYLLYKSQRKRERLIFSSFTIFYVLNTLYYIISSEYIHSTSITPFSFQLLSNGSFVIVLFFVFPLEVLLPSYLKKRWFVLVFLIPALIYNGIWFFLCHNGMEVIHLTNVQVLLSELNNASVALRLIFFCLIILFFAASILFMLWAHNRYMTDRVLRIYAYSTIPIMGIYILIVIYGLTPALYVSHMLYMSFFNSYISYLLVHTEEYIEKGKRNTVVEAEKSPQTPADNDIKEQDIQLLHQLDLLMESEQLYCSPELSLPALARILGTNRTKLSEIIRSKGFSNFSAYLNSYRLKKFLQIMEADESEKISNAAFLAGFGSKASLHRCFISAFGVSPSKYLKRQ